MLASLNSDKTNFGQSKVERYKWKSVGEPGTFDWINKEQLKVDTRYQRDTLAQKVLEITKNWSWPACGVLVVAFREDENEYWVMDGQHRQVAAMRRTDIKTLPCIVFIVENIEQEAAIFLAVNTNRKPLRAMERYKALIVSKDSTAIFVDDLIQQAGRFPARYSSPTTVACVTLLRKHATHSRSALIDIWPLISEVSQGQSLHNYVVGGLMHIQKNLPDGVSLLNKRLRDRVIQVGYEAMNDGAIRAATYHRKGGEKIWAQGILEVLNKGLRNTIKLAGGDTDE